MIPIRRQHTEENIDSWLMSYADMITLLLCFFVIYASASEPKKDKMSAVAEGMANATADAHRLADLELDRLIVQEDIAAAYRSQADEIGTINAQLQRAVELERQFSAERAKAFGEFAAVPSTQREFELDVRSHG